MKVYAIEVEITDINDNAPTFGEAEKELRISETTTPGSRFALSMAHDPDVGANSLQSYALSGDEHFSLSVQAGGEGEKSPELVLAKALDREQAAFHELLLRASDGGDPSRTGTARIRVAVLDANDNAPAFSQAVYTVRVAEDVPVGSTLLSVTATDPDEGTNGEVMYTLRKVTNIAVEYFQLDRGTGEITLLKNLDFEEVDFYELELQAQDKGGLSDKARVSISVTDVNDNAPEIWQAQPNPDWRFSQTQRPGTSGSQNGEEGGAWPNNQFDTEMLQAMILASANEAADVNATLGGGTGTMGLSARYGPQFTLQHVPDYRQNVYIPGSTATLSNAAGKRDAKPSGGNKKKSGKKEKK
ncbi:protocadherin gamma-A11-like isoform X30 [Tympanuchus pallidicinctus]|uniref:protocadherin gamma-A11-like isoform X29 n=1 Tax=Tympanuchus pallidicinctus TaxID=109042 RepID=UPI002287633C|nr:protocadherin gamma-A11-like isoform X29 [Tympanuchus pallidicinctus]XP_052540554.1 protocadherin gamma-A11-like isoform X30 [Tympanuchus pallidicinctus]